MKTLALLLLLFVNPMANASPLLRDPAPGPLPSWRDGAVKQRILLFLDQVELSYVPQSKRIATFDNDGTLWVEQEMYTQVHFIFQRIRALAWNNPSWKETQPFKAVIENDGSVMSKFTGRDFATLMGASQAGLTSEEFRALARNWLRTAIHPRFGKPYRECVYQPMLELLQLLRARGFKTFIVSGGGTEFMRAYAEEVYGIPPEQVIGTSMKTTFEIRDGRAMVVQQAEVNSVDDGPGKAINIDLQIGQRPLLAFGNSDGDLEMLQYASADAGPRLMLLLHHDDEEREYAYDRNSRVGRLDKAWDQALRMGWAMVSMKNDFLYVFPWERELKVPLPARKPYRAPPPVRRWRN